MRKRTPSDVTPIIKREEVLEPDGSGTSACLVVIYGPNIGMRHQLDGANKVIIGRDPSCDLVLHEPAVSRKHAEIVPSKGLYFLKDLKSTNGTFLNDLPVMRPVPLQPGDRIRLATVILKFISGVDIESKYHEELYNLSITDGLLGIPNRRYLEYALDKEISRARRHNRPLSILMFDIDHFKKINDTYGHLAGDAALKQLAELVRCMIRKEEILCRYGGEEFVLIMPETAEREAFAAAERIRRAVAGNVFTYGDLQFKFTISIGVAEWHNGITQEDLLRLADERLYMAKKQGRNRTVGTDTTVSIKPKQGSDNE